MVERVQRVTVEGGPVAFAPTKDELKLQIELKHEPDEKVDKLHIIVSDRLGDTTWRGTWAGRSVEEAYEGSTKLDSEGPPTDVLWKGQGLAEGAFASPLRSPFRITAMAECSKLPQEEAPLSQSPPNEEKCPFAEEGPEEKPPAWALRSLTLVASGVTSRSFSVRDYIAGEFRIGEGVKERFTFATGVETDVAVNWEFSTDTTGVQSGTLELISIPKKAAVWTKAMDREALLAKTLAITADGVDDKALKAALLATDSPFILRLTVKGAGEEQWLGSAWTYVDVVVASVELRWGPAALIPVDKAPQGLRAGARKAEALLLRTLKGGGPASKPEDELTEKEAVDEDPKDARAIAPGETKLHLRSNIFYQSLGEWQDETMADLHAELWADGPRLPLVAVVKARSAKGEAVDAPLALKGTRLLFDWDDPKLDKAAGAPNAAWLAWALEKEARDATADAPESTNCPVANGGKRGSGGAPVFPTQAGVDDQAAGPGVFPWRVQRFTDAGGDRGWAALSTVYTGPTKDYQGQAGVLFQPSRIAGDTYRVRAYVYTGAAGDFAKAVSGPDLWEDARVAGLPAAMAGPFEMWRRVDVLSYLPLTGGQPQLDFAAVGSRYQPARLFLAPPASIDPQRAETLWKEVVKKRLDTLNDKAKWERVLASPQRPEAGALLTLKTYTAAIDPWYSAALDALDKAKTVPSGRIASAKAAPVWENAAKYLTPAELTSLEGEAAKLMGTHALPWNALYPRAAALDEAYGLMSFLTGADPKEWIEFGVKRHILDPDALGDKAGASTQKDKQGLHIVHAATPSTTRVDTKGSAFAVLGKQVGLTDADRHHCGFYATRPDMADLVEVAGFSFGAGGTIPGRAEVKPKTAASDFTVFLSGALLDDATWGPDVARAVTTYCNGVVGKVLSLYEGEVDFDAHKEREEDLHRERDVDLWQDWAMLTVRGTATAVTKAMGKIDAALALGSKGFVELKTRAKGNDQDVYVTWVDPLDEALALRVNFSVGRTSLWDGERRSLRRWVAAAYGASRSPIAHLYVHHRDNSNGRKRAASVQSFLEKLLSIARRRVKVNPPCDLRSIAREQSERDIYLSLEGVFDEKKCTRLRFDSHSASIRKNGIMGACRQFVELASKAVAEPAQPVVYLYYKDTKDGRHRKLKVANFLDVLFVAEGRAVPDQLDPSLDTAPLVAHEMAHGLSLEHAPPVDLATTWRHVEGVNCLMNYDATETEFCGLCNLWLRGWKIGTKAAPKFPLSAVGYPKHAASKSTVAPVLPSPTEEEPLHAVGWHGTISGARDSLEAGLKAMESSWDKDSGGELGPGFYVATTYETACVYGAGMAELKGDRVDVWRVELTEPLAKLTGSAVPNDKQFAKYVVDEFKDFDYLWNTNDVNPTSQYKFNDRALPKLRISLHRQGMAPDQAFSEAEKKHKTVAEKSGKSRPKVVRVGPVINVVPVVGDGDCFFHSIAYHCVMPQDQRVNYADGARTFGQTDQEKGWTRTCRADLAADLCTAVYNQNKGQLIALNADPQLTDAGHRYETRWDRLSGFGTDLAHWGATLLETVTLMDEAACGVVRPPKVIWGDVQFLFELILARYNTFTRIIVHHGGVAPLVYGANAGNAIHLRHHGAHYEVVRP